LETLRTQAEDCAIKHVCISSSHPPPDTAPIPIPSASSLAQSSILRYEGELHAVIKKHRDSILQLLMSVPTSGSPPDLLLQYVELCRSHFPIMTGLSGLISHLGRKRISNHDLEILICNAQDKAIELHFSAMMKRVSPSASIPASEEKAVILQAIPYHLKIPSNLWLNQKLSLKPGKFDPAIILKTPPRNKDSTIPGQDDNEGEYGIHSKTIDGVGDGTHLITASFIKSKDKIRDYFLIISTNFYAQILTASRLIQVVLTNHFPF
jgi:hypothetical protein